MGEQEDQNKRLQRELEVANEQLALAREVTHRSPSNSLSRHSRPNSFASITSSTSEVAETPEDAQLASSSDETGESVSRFIHGVKDRCFMRALCSLQLPCAESEG